MLDEKTERLRKMVEARISTLDETRVDEITEQLSKLGEFIVRAWLKQHSKTMEMGLSTEFEEKPKDSST